VRLAIDKKPIYLEVGVHIADVTHYVSAGSKLDNMAAERGTTVYLCDRRIDMLPEVLGSNLCSLMAHVNRPSFSVIWRLALLPGNRLLILSESFHKTIIRSCASFTYQQAQDILNAVNSLYPQSASICSLSTVRRTLDATISNSEKLQSVLGFLNIQKQENVLESQKLSEKMELATSIYLLNIVAKVRRAARLDAGALTLSSPEVRFDMTPSTNSCGSNKNLAYKDGCTGKLMDCTESGSLNEDSSVLKLTCKEPLEANGLVEECMLMANIAVAQKIHSAYPDLAVLRRHPTPPADNFAELEATLQAANSLTRFQEEASVQRITDQPMKENLPQQEHTSILSWDSSKALAISLDLLKAATTPAFASLVRMLVTRCMMQAVYFCAADLSLPDFWHYGLATPLYTHFTSPIRRYADILVHRLLSAAIQGGGSPWPHCSKKALSEMTSHLNKRHRMAQYVSR
jgi:exosome complex exonuclease DIS3/RRP44